MTKAVILTLEAEDTGGTIDVRVKLGDTPVVFLRPGTRYADRALEIAEELLAEALAALLIRVAPEHFGIPNSVASSQEEG